MSRTQSRSRVRPFLVAVFAAAAVLPGSIQAQPYPSKPIEWISHTSAGSGTDLFGAAVRVGLGDRRLQRPRPHSGGRIPAGRAARGLKA